MAGSVNKVILIGNLGKDPEVRAMQSGGENSGERQERTQWHNIVIFNEGIAGIAERYLKKGSKVYIEGQMETRKWTDKDGNDKYTTEVVLRPFRGELTLLDGKRDDDGADARRDASKDAYAPRADARSAKPAQGFDGIEAEIPFDRLRTLA